MSEINENNAVNEEESTEQLSEILQIRRDKLAKLQQAGKDPFEVTVFDRNAYSQDIIDNFEDYEGKEVAVAGRIMSWRDMGKASFLDLNDFKGKIQLYVKLDVVGEENYRGMAMMDIGDIVGVRGEVFRTRRGEVSIKAHELKLLSKSLKPLPEKWHGLTNTDARYRQRYVDLIINPKVRETFVRRSRIISAIRRYLDGQGFLEVETPMLVANAGGAAARPFETHFNALNEDLKLRISLELYLKRLIVGGMEKV